MPCLSGQFNAAIGALINVGVLPAGTLQPGGTTPTQITAFPALIDTGQRSPAFLLKWFRQWGYNP